MAHVCYGHAGVRVKCWPSGRRPNWPVALFPPPFCLCLLEEEKEEISTTKAESFNFSLSPRELNRLMIAAAGRCHPCFSAVGMTVCQNDVDRGQFLGSFMAPDSGAQHQIQEVLQRCVSKTSKSRKEERFIRSPNMFLGPTVDLGLYFHLLHRFWW